MNGFLRGRLGRWQRVQRGSQLPRTRAIDKRAVMKESGKCRSGRDWVRTRVTGPSGRGGKMPHPFGNHERVAA